MECLEQSPVTKANQKEGSASKPTHCPLGGWMGLVGQLEFHDTARGYRTQQVTLSSPARRAIPNIPKLKDLPQLLKTEHP